MRNVFDVTAKRLTFDYHLNETYMKLQVNIFIKGTGTKIGQFVTSAQNIQKAFYKHFKGFQRYGLCATECYYRLSDV